MKKIIFSVVTIILIIVSIMIFLTISKQHKNILYSWNIKNITDSKFNEVLKKLNIKVIYQEFPSNYLKKNDNEFLMEMVNRNIEVYHLTGDPSWTANGNNKELLLEIDKVDLYNKNNKYKIKGLVFDIEPYLEKSDDFNFKNYVDALTNTYKYIKDKNLEMIVCIPYWYDKKDLGLLEELIKNSDGISVMNYKIDGTINNIKDEVTLAKKYNKKINTIYEVNMTSDNYFSSYSKINKDYQELYSKYNYSKLSKAYHHYSSIVEKSDLLK